jgi:membrane-associated phospholipid phosphatase
MEKFTAWRTFYVKKVQDSTIAWWHKSYGLDWAVGIVLFVIVHGITFFTEPVSRFLPPNDPTVMYPSEPDIIPTSVLFILALLLPWIAIGLMQVKHKNPHDFHHGTLCLFLIVLTNNTVTTALKYTAGRYRPNYLAVHDTDARLSFPSGHASTAFAGMTFLTLYLLGKLRLCSHTSSTSFSKFTVCASPLLLASYIAVSRTMDYHHNFSDIIAGSIIGLATACCIYFMYYPPLHSTFSHEPKFHSELTPPVTVEMKEVRVESLPSAAEVPLQYADKIQEPDAPAATCV